MKKTRKNTITEASIIANGLNKEIGPKLAIRFLMIALFEGFIQRLIRRRNRMVRSIQIDLEYRQLLNDQDR